LKIKINILLHGDNSWTVSLRQIHFVAVKYDGHYIHTRFIKIIILFDESVKYGDGAKFWGYVGTNAEPLRVLFCI